MYQKKTKEKNKSSYIWEENRGQEKYLTPSGLPRILTVAMPMSSRGWPALDPLRMDGMATEVNVWDPSLEGALWHEPTHLISGSRRRSRRRANKNTVCTESPSDPTHVKVTWLAFSCLAAASG